VRNGKKKLMKKYPENIKVIMTQYYNEPSKKKQRAKKWVKSMNKGW
jgi:hypothetical protein